MREIELSRGMTCIIDDEDFEKVSKYKWYAHNTGNGFYAATNMHPGILYMHHLIIGKRQGFIIDHINRDRLDNRKENLRFVTKHQNSLNSVSKNKNFPKGVCYVSETGKYRAQIMFNGHNIYIGSYDEVNIASLAYNQKAQELFGEYAYLNKEK